MHVFRQNPYDLSPARATRSAGSVLAAKRPRIERPPNKQMKGFAIASI